MLISWFANAQTSVKADIPNCHIEERSKVIKMHPNPAQTYMIIEIPGRSDGRTTDLYVWDMLFKTEMTIPDVPIGVPFMMDISTLKKGRHILRTEMDRNFSLGVFIKD
jgi:hypothetical protein